MHGRAYHTLVLTFLLVVFGYIRVVHWVHLTFFSSILTVTLVAEDGSSASVRVSGGACPSGAHHEGPEFLASSSARPYTYKTSEAKPRCREPAVFSGRPAEFKLWLFSLEEALRTWSQEIQSSTHRHFWTAMRDGGSLASGTKKEDR